MSRISNIKNSKTRVRNLSVNTFMNTDIEKAVEVLNQGGIVIFPTDTAFGIGCGIDDEAAIKRLFNIRKRPYSQATPVLVNNIDMVKKYVLEFPQDVELLASQYWPGALTIVMKAKETVPNLVNGGGDTVGIRIPDHDIVLKLIENVGVGILGPSANFHGEPTPYDFRDLNPELVSLVDYVVEGECKLKDVSTVIDCSVNPWKIIREGAVKLNLSRTFLKPRSRLGGCRSSFFHVSLILRGGKVLDL